MNHIPVSRMKIVLMHYHLKTGGVTTVLKQQAESIRDTCNVLMLTGDKPDDPFLYPAVEIPGLGYDVKGKPPQPPHIVADDVETAIHERWPDGCDVIHVHNATLAKNRNFLKILKLLRKHGHRVLIQIHDFAEDGRPANYFPEEYPADCHYGVINSRDYNILLEVGFNKQGVHKIYNTVSLPVRVDDHGEPDKTVLYPARAIRRKNIGEALLITLFLNNGEILAITLPPNSPADLQSYMDWKNFAAENDLHVLFEAGLKQDFKKLVASAKCILTTSINEGFGFSFLEPWTFGMFLWGRDIPDITTDFKQNKIRLDHLYTRINTPLDWIGENDFYRVWKDTFLKTTAAFGAVFDESSVLKAFSYITENKTIDFGLLDESFQKKVILRILSDRNAGRQLLSMNPMLSNPGFMPGKDGLIKHNQDAIRAAYSPSAYRHGLLNIYRAVMEKDVKHCIDKHLLLKRFLSPENFSLLKWKPYI